MTGQEMLAEAVLASKTLFTRYVTGFNDNNRTRQAPNLPNHAIWCLGHCALTMNRVAQNMDGQPIPDSDFSADDGPADGNRFRTESIAFGSAPTDESDHYPPLARGLEVYNSACDRLAAAVRAADQETLNRNIPWGQSELPLWSLVLRVAFHNGMHGGQITDLRRAIGLDRVIK